MRKLLCFVSALVLLVTVSSCRNDQRRAKNYNDKTLADDDAIHFITNGLEGSLTEIKAAGLAKSRSANPDIISLANMMIADHTEIVKELKKIQADKLVSNRDNSSSEDDNSLAVLSTKTGVEFDKAYIEMAVMDHEKAIELFKGVSNHTSGTIQDFATKTLTKLHKHLDSAKSIGANLK
jgi:putative membrane protein